MWTDSITITQTPCVGCPRKRPFPEAIKGSPRHDRPPTANLGPRTGKGLYEYDGSAWDRINTDEPSVLGIYNDMLVAVFPGKGIYLYDGSAWDRINTDDTAEALAGGGISTLFADFGANGLEEYNGETWKKVNDNDAENMIAVDID